MDTMSAYQLSELSEFSAHCEPSTEFPVSFSSFLLPQTLHAQSRRTGFFSAFHCYQLCAALCVLNHTLPVRSKWRFSFCKLLILQ